MNYLKLHDNIISVAKQRNLKETYFENHHILPKCLGGSNDQKNLVKVTAKEHYVLHHLLTKIYPNNSKIWFAFVMLTVKTKKHKRQFLTSRMYEKSKKIRSELMSGENNVNYKNKTGGSKGKKWSEESKQKLRLIKLGKKRSPFKRSSPTKETREKMSKALTGRKLSNETKSKISEGLYRMNASK